MPCRSFRDFRALRPRALRLGEGRGAPDTRKKGSFEDHVLWNRRSPGHRGEIRVEPPGCRLIVREPKIAAETAVADSICVNGCCLTVVAVEGETFAFQAGRKRSPARIWAI